MGKICDSCLRRKVERDAVREQCYLVVACLGIASSRALLLEVASWKVKIESMMRSVQKVAREVDGSLGHHFSPPRSLKTFT